MVRLKAARVLRIQCKNEVEGRKVLQGRKILIHLKGDLPET